MPDHTQNGLIEVACRMEHLNGALLRQLIDPLLILLMLQGIFDRYLSENLRRKCRQLIEFNLRSLRQRIPDSEYTRIEQTDNVPRVSCINYIPILCQKLLRLR
ncbi:hypothetical protein D3C78_1591400 [compost metagenome]